MRLMLSIAALFLAGCQPAALAPAGPGDPLGRELAGRIAGQPQSCISTFANQGFRVVDQATIAYDLGRTFWVNRLQDACPSLSPHNFVVVERAGTQLCRGDRVRGQEPGSSIPGPSCSLHDWVPYRRP